MTNQKKPFYRTFWFWFWAILAFLFYMGSRQEKTLLFPFILIVGLYFFYNGIIKEESWWGDAIREFFISKTGKIILFFLFILFILSRVIISLLKH